MNVGEEKNGHALGCERKMGDRLGRERSEVGTRDLFTFFRGAMA